MKNTVLVILAIIFATVVNIGYLHFYFLPRLEPKVPAWNTEIKKIINTGQEMPPLYRVDTRPDAVASICDAMRRWDDSNRLSVLFNDVEHHADMMNLISDAEIERIRQRALIAFANVTLEASWINTGIRCGAQAESLSIPALLHINRNQTRSMLKDKTVLPENFEQRSRQAALSSTKAILAAADAYPLQANNIENIRFAIKRENIWDFSLSELGFSTHEIALLRE